MKQLRLTIDMENFTFTPPEAEIARILREYADLISRDQVQPKVLYDSNGNLVGKVRLVLVPGLDRA